MNNRLLLAPNPDQGPSRPPWKRPHRCLNQGCHGFIKEERNGDYVTITCSSCGDKEENLHRPKTVFEEREEQRALEVWPLVEEPELTQELEKYCDLRRRGHDDEGIQNHTGWPEYYRNLLLGEAVRRGMKGTNENRDAAFREWLLERHNVGIGIRHICRLSGRSQTETREAFEEAIETDEITLPPQASEPPPANGFRKPKPKQKLDITDPQLTKQLERYCDWRRRGYSVGAIRNRIAWPEYYLDLLLEEAARREMPGSNESATEAFQAWLLEVHASGMPIDDICRMSYRCESETLEELTAAIETNLGIDQWTTMQENYAEANADWP